MKTITTKELKKRIENVKKELETCQDIKRRCFLEATINLYRDELKRRAR